MKSTRLPHNTDSDESIRQWAIDNSLHLKAVTDIPLIRTCMDAPNVASINWLLPGQPITRYNNLPRRMR